MSQRLQGLVPRRLMPIVAGRLAEEPVVLLQGPRSVGKSTLLRSLAASVSAEIIDLDDVAVRDAVGRDPGTFVAGARPVCGTSTSTSRSSSMRSKPSSTATADPVDSF